MLTEEAKKEWVEVYFKDQVSKHLPQEEEYMLKEMLKTAQFVREDDEKTFSCTLCRKPVLRPYRCEDCKEDLYICTICYATGNNGLLVSTCPACKVEGMNIVEICEINECFLKQAQIKCIDRQCPTRNQA